MHLMYMNANSKKKYSLNVQSAILLFLFNIVILLIGCEGESGAPKDNAENLIPSIEAVPARYGALPLTERLTGIVKAKNQIEIYPQISAKIERVYVHNGDIIQKGEPLIRLRDNEYQERLKQSKANFQITVAQAKQAEAQYTEIQSELKRIEVLAAKNLASPAELQSAKTKTISAEANLELAKARVEQAQATVDEREEALSETIIRAPVSGSIGNRDAEVGMLVKTDTRLFTLGQLDNVKIVIVLTDRELNYIKVGQSANIFTENPAYDALRASLSRISPFLHPVTHSTDAEIDLLNMDRRFKPGMFVTVDVEYGESENATLVPLSALYDNPTTGVTGVYVCKDTLKGELVSEWGTDKAFKLTNPVFFEFIPVDVIARGRMQAGINGVKPGKWVATMGQNLLAGESGEARVRIVNWDWVEQLQNLQRQDLLKEVMKKQQEANKDTASSNKK